MKKKKTVTKIIKKKFTFSFKDLIGIILVSLAIGILIGAIIIYDNKDFTISNMPKELTDFITAYDNITTNFYKKTSKKKLLDAALEGMLNSLDDPYTVFMDTDDAVTFDNIVNSKYEGIGITVKKVENKIEIISVFKNSPADKVGLKEGDQIIEINNKKIKDYSVTDISNLIKNVDNKVTLKVSRNNLTYDYKISKGEIMVPTVSSNLFNEEDQKIGYIKIDLFSNTTYQEFIKELKKLEKKKIASLIIDVRDNSGGHLDQVQKLVDIFLEKKAVIYQIEGKSSKKVYATTKEKRNYKIAVLINHTSASASEILAAAMQESYKATIIGTNSYGKNSIQKQQKLSNGSLVKYTVKKWLTPNGKSIENNGVIPDIVVGQKEDYYNNPTIDNDQQLQKAIEILK